MAGPIARKSRGICADDGNQQKDAGRGETAENWAKLDGQPRVSRDGQKDKRQQGCAAGDGQRNKETAQLDPPAGVTKVSRRGKARLIVSLFIALRSAGHAMRSSA